MSQNPELFSEEPVMEQDGAAGMDLSELTKAYPRSLIQHSQTQIIIPPLIALTQSQMQSLNTEPVVTQPQSLSDINLSSELSPDHEPNTRIASELQTPVSNNRKRATSQSSHIPHKLCCVETEDMSDGESLNDQDTSKLTGKVALVIDSIEPETQQQAKPEAAIPKKEQGDKTGGDLVVLVDYSDSEDEDEQIEVAKVSDESEVQTKPEEQQVDETVGAFNNKDLILKPKTPIHNLNTFLENLSGELKTFFESLNAQHSGFLVCVEVKVEYTKPNGQSVSGQLSARDLFINNKLHNPVLLERIIKQLRIRNRKLARGKYGLVLSNVELADLHVTKHQAYSGYGFQKLPVFLASKKAIINVKNDKFNDQRL